MAYKGQGQFQNKEWKPLWSKEPNEKGYVSESIKRCEKGDQDILKRFMNAVDASQINQVPVGTSVIRAGYKYWLNEGEWGLYIKRRQESDDFESQNTEQKQYQGQNYTVKEPAENYVKQPKDPRQDRDEVLFKKIENIEGMLAELMMAFGKDPFQKAAEVKSNTPNDHGNETSGSNFASGPGTLTEVQGSINSAPEARTNDVATKENEDLTPGRLTEDEERQLEL